MSGIGDIRHAQIAVLAVLLAVGSLFLEFAIDAANVAAVLLAALIGQYGLDRAVRRPFNWRSASITALSLALLLRANHWWLFAIAAGVAVASKFLLRYRGKHLFNPSNFVLALGAVLAAEYVWISPGQWGRAALLWLLVACAAVFILFRVRTADVSLSFSVVFGVLVGVRGVVLEDPPALAMHTLSSGAFLLFTFFMISDPRTLPDARHGRIVFGVLCAALAYFLQFHLHQNYALFYSLFAVSLLTPILDRLWSAKRFDWDSALFGASARAKNSGRAALPGGDSLSAPAPDAALPALLPVSAAFDEGGAVTKGRVMT